MALERQPAFPKLHHAVIAGEPIVLGASVDRPPTPRAFELSEILANFSLPRHKHGEGLLIGKIADYIELLQENRDRASLECRLGVFQLNLRSSRVYRHACEL
jgi:hypothetical protein